MENQEKDNSQLVGEFVKKQRIEKLKSAAFEATGFATYVGGNVAIDKYFSDDRTLETAVSTAAFYGAVRGGREGYKRLRDARFRRNAPDDVGDILEKTNKQIDEIEINRFREGIVADEEEIWKDVLGVDVKVKPLPSYITLKMVKKLNSLGMGLRYIPDIEFSEEEIKAMEPKQYMELLSQRYPGWSHEQKKDEEEKLTGMPEDIYWKDVRDGCVEMPSLPGQWAAIELIKKPKNSNDHYNYSPLMKELRIDSRRFRESIDDVELRAIYHGKTLLNKLKIDTRRAEVRLPSVLEWNLLGIRDDFGDGKISEYTDTKFVHPNTSERFSKGRVAIGYGDPGSLEYAYTNSTTVFSKGFRFGVFFFDENTPGTPRELPAYHPDEANNENV